MNAPMSTRRRAGLVAALALALVWSGTASGARHDPDRIAFGKMIGGKVHFATFWRGNGNWKDAILVAANTDGEWNQAMKEVDSNNGFIVKTTGDPQPPPAVDWSRQLVVLVALGRSSDSVEVREVHRQGHQLHVYVHIRPGGPVGEVDPSPHELVAVNRKSIEAVTAHYDWAPPGMPTFVKPGHAASRSEPTAAGGASPPAGGARADTVSTATPGTTDGH